VRLRVFEREDGHAVALLRLQLTARRDHAADGRVRLNRLPTTRSPGLRRIGAHRGLRQLRDRLRPELLQFAAIAVDRMAAPVEPERLFFKCELLHLAPRRGGRQHDDGRIVRAGGWLQLAEQSALALFAIALLARAVLAGRIDGCHNPWPRLARMSSDAGGPCVERASLREALEHALVEQA